MKKKLTPVQNTIKKLSDQIVSAQNPIRILDAIKWTPEIKDQFFSKKCKELPQIDATYYHNRDLGFNPKELSKKFVLIQKDIQKKIGKKHTAGQMMYRMCEEYRRAIELIQFRGTNHFATLSRDLYGTTSDSLYKNQPSLADLGDSMVIALSNLQTTTSVQEETKNITDQEAVRKLRRRFKTIFSEIPSGKDIKVILSDGIVADAAAGSDYLKIRRQVKLSERDIRMLEVHEGWVHLGTTLNGNEQKICTFLSKGAPSTTVTQEGLAVLMEILTFNSYPGRLRKLTNRTRAIHLAEQGANFLEVFHFFEREGYTKEESYSASVRVFRGSHPTGGPFTKDISYHKGFILIYNYIRLAVQKGDLDKVPLLFCGKLALDDIHHISQLVKEGLVSYPSFLPSVFKDIRGLSAWMCYSIFLNQFNLKLMS